MVTAAKTQKSQRSGRTGAADKVALYAAVGPELVHFEVDIKACTLSRKASISVPDIIQYAWPDPARPCLYVASSNGSPGVAGDNNHLSALRVDPESGALSLHGQRAALPSRPCHITLDIPRKHALAAYSTPLLATVHRIAADGTIGEEVRQPEGLDVGFYPHQIRVTPSNKLAIIVSRGNRPTRTKPEEPGGLKVFDFRNGVLTNKTTIAPGQGAGFGPRHLDFHPSKPWIFVALELQNKIHVYTLQDDVISPEPLFVKETLIKRSRVAPYQIVGPIHVHPNGRFVYTANQGSGTVEFEGRPFFAGGENNIAVFSVNQRTGEPTLIQHIDTRGIHPRTFSIDPSGRMLVAANISAFSVRDTSTSTATIPACLSTFRIGSDGKLSFVAKYDVETEGKRRLFWVSFFPLPGLDKG